MNKWKEFVSFSLILATISLTSGCSAEERQEKDEEVSEQVAQVEEDPRDHWLDEAEIVGQVSKEMSDWLFDIVQLIDQEDAEGLAERLIDDYEMKAIEEGLRPRRIAGSIEKVYGVELFKNEENSDHPDNFYILAQGENETLGIILTPAEAGKLSSFHLKVEQDQDENKKQYADQLSEAQNIVGLIESGAVDDYLTVTREVPIAEDIRKRTFEELNELVSLAGEKINSYTEIISRDSMDKIEAKNIEGRIVEITIADYYESVPLIEYFFAYDEQGKLLDMEYRAFSS